MNSKEFRFLLTHSSIYGLGTVISRIVAFVLLPVYTRHLRPADYGVLEVTDITTYLIGLVVTIGIARALSRFYYEEEDTEQRKAVVGTTYILYGAIALLSAPLLFFASSPLAGLLVGSADKAEYFEISFVTLLVGGFVEIGLMYLRVTKRPGLFISMTVSRLVLLVSFNILFVVHFQMGVLGILYSSMIVRSLYAILLTVPILWRVGARLSLSLSGQMLKYSLPMIPSTLASTFVKQSDKYFVLHFLSMSNMGLYSLSLKIGNSIHNLLTVPFNMAFIPRRFELMKREDAAGLYARVFTLYIFAVGTVGLAIAVFIPEIIKVMVTPEFYPAAKFIPLVVFSMIVYGTHYHFDFGILYSKKTKYLAYINLVSAAVNLVTNFLLIRAFGLWGAIISGTAVLMLQSCLLYWQSAKLYAIPYEFGKVLSFMAVAVGVYFVSVLVSTGNVIYNVALKGLLFVLFPYMLVLLRIVTDRERKQVSRVILSRIAPALRLKPVVTKE